MARVIDVGELEHICKKGYVVQHHPDYGGLASYGAMHSLMRVLQVTRTGAVCNVLVEYCDGPKRGALSRITCTLAGKRDGTNVPVFTSVPDEERIRRLGAAMAAADPGAKVESPSGVRLLTVSDLFELRFGFCMWHPNADDARDLCWQKPGTSPVLDLVLVSGVTRSAVNPHGYSVSVVPLAPSKQGFVPLPGATRSISSDGRWRGERPMLAPLDLKGLAMLALGQAGLDKSPKGVLEQFLASNLPGREPPAEYNAPRFLRFFKVEIGELAQVVARAHRKTVRGVLDVAPIDRTTLQHVELETHSRLLCLLASHADPGANSIKADNQPAHSRREGSKGRETMNTKSGLINSIFEHFKSDLAPAAVDGIKIGMSCGTAGAAMQRAMRKVFGVHYERHLVGPYGTYVKAAEPVVGAIILSVAGHALRFYGKELPGRDTVMAASRLVITGVTKDIVEILSEKVLRLAKTVASELLLSDKE